jgi:hypothetical protein
MFWIMNVDTAGDNNCIYEMDPASGYTGNRICPAWTTSQRGLAYDPTTNTWYAGGWNEDTIYHLAPDGTILDSAYVGLSISGLAYNPDTQHLFVQVNGGTNDVYVLDASAPGDYPQTGQFHIGTLASGAGLEIDCGGNLWAVDQSNEMVIQVESGETISLCTQDVPWFSEEPTSGTVSASGSLPVDVIFNATGLAQGDYTADLVIYNNDPDENPVTVPVVMHVELPAPPAITSITPDSGNNNEVAHITNLAGSDFQDGATVRLIKTGQTDIVATNVVVVNSSQITCNLDLRGVALGQWTARVTNPDSQSVELPNGFTVKGCVYLPIILKNQP